MGPASHGPSCRSAGEPVLASRGQLTVNNLTSAISSAHAVFVDDVDFNEGAISVRTTGTAGSIGTAQATIKGEDDLAIGLRSPMAPRPSSKDEYSRSGSNRCCGWRGNDA